MPEGTLTIKFDRVWFHYHGASEAVFSDLEATLEVKPIAAVIGRSGVGKTTLARLLCGELTPESGEILWECDGRLAQPLHRVYLPQESSLPPWLRLQSLWSMVAAASGTQASKRVPARLRKLLDQFASRYPTELSGGQQRRVELALVLASGSTVTVLDEPYSGLDYPEAVALTRDLEELAQAGLSRYVIISHDLHLLSRFRFPVFGLLGENQLLCLGDSASCERQEEAVGSAARLAAFENAMSEQGML